MKVEQIKLQQLKEIAQQFIKNEYNMELDIPIKINGRFKTTLGSYRETYAGKPVQIDIAKRLLQYADERVTAGVIKHELVHFALKKLNKPYKDGDEYFERELERLKLPSSVNKERSIQYVGEKYVFKCKKCDKQLLSSIKKVRNETKSFISPCCKSSIRYVKTTIHDGTDNGICKFIEN